MMHERRIPSLPLCVADLAHEGFDYVGAARAADVGVHLPELLERVRDPSNAAADTDRASPPSRSEWTAMQARTSSCPSWGASVNSGQGSVENWAATSERCNVSLATRCTSTSVLNVGAEAAHMPH
jgi:hypothetical protein